MTGNPCWQAIPTKLSEAQFEEFVLPHLSRGRRGPAPTLSLHKIFNYILKALYMGCQWMMLPIESNDKGRPEIHHTRIYRKMRRWQADGSIDRIFAGTVHKLHQDQILDLSVIHGDGTTTAAKKGGDNRFCRSKARWLNKYDCYVLLRKRESRTGWRQKAAFCLYTSSALS
jgi:transposase